MLESGNAVMMRGIGPAGKRTKKEEARSGELIVVGRPVEPMTHALP